MPSGTCAAQHHWIELQQLGRRCLRRNATLTAFTTLCEHVLVEAQPAATC
ncbi:hypothetical protein AVDCRST_MAG94-5082 [uncultured Leptolyngbya sp.]|uniref:Uncharacterized protein n=1 Tax=uncultured Leptolyngbya sp. TaxID=332963 RepID=A0A6J4NE41_9CYAN|nr:hypothetical protein AVDCRST_MAG94-5082 [uncultured Leptolyngbya sp.]